jgi:hypothetical protein
MCYEFDRLYEKARAVEHLRRKQKNADELKQHGRPATPAKPVESTEPGKRQEPVPA